MKKIIISTIFLSTFATSPTLSDFKKEFENLNEIQIELKSFACDHENTTNKKESESSFWDYLEKFAQWVQNLLKTSKSIWLQLIAVFFLGILMSLTPCIYPMIPITAGILQSYGSRSFVHNFIVSFLYSLGVATTFATFGLIAAFTGHLFGNLLTNPIFIIFVVLFMAYMALSMFGAFEMYIPKFMQKNSQIKFKSVFSAFLSGVISGSVASPCLTPGLAFLLTLVATMANKFLGFILLFTAGIGLSIPLLIIGTFSSSLNVLPKAGIWMIEIKKIFGLILFGMCFYFLGNIISPSYLLILISIFCLLIGIYYFYSNFSKKSGKANYKIRIFNNLFGTLFFISSILLGIKTFQELTIQKEEIATNDSLWHTNLETALNEAKLLKQNILVDLGGEFCSICKVIDKRIFADKDVQEALRNFVALKIDASKQPDEYNFFKENFQVMGVPAILLLTADLKLIKRWGSDLYNKNPKAFIDELK